MPKAARNATRVRLVSEGAGWAREVGSMTAPRKLFAAAVLAGCGHNIAGLTFGTGAGSAHAEGGLMHVESALAPKGDLPLNSRCLGQVWPDVAAECLTGAGAGHAGAVRTVTFGQQVGAATTVLIRMPQPQIAAR